MYTFLKYQRCTRLPKRVTMEFQFHALKDADQRDLWKWLPSRSFHLMLPWPSWLSSQLSALMIAFTNYDFQHLPPNKLLDRLVWPTTNIWSLKVPSVLPLVLILSPDISFGAGSFYFTNRKLVSSQLSLPTIYQGKRIFVIFLLPLFLHHYLDILRHV